MTDLDDEEELIEMEEFDYDFEPEEVWEDDAEEMLNDTEIVLEPSEEQEFELMPDAHLESIHEGSTVNVSTSKDDTPLNMAMVDEVPNFPGGDAAMYRWLSANLVYPAEAQEEGVSGKVIVSFIVEKDGSLSNVQVVRGKHPALDKEAVRAVKAMPKWNPAINNGTFVRVTYMLPISFKLQD